MTAQRKVVVALVVIAAILAGSIPFVLRYTERQTAQRAVSAYVAALAESLRTHNPELLNEVTDPREKGRVTAYITQLWGQGIFVDGELLNMSMVDYSSTENTVTVVMKEKWRYKELDKNTRTQIGKPVIENDLLEYTLIKRDGRLVVYLSIDAEDTESAKNAPSSFESGTLDK